MVKCKYFLCLLIGLGLLPCGFAMRPVDSLHLPDSLKTVYETVVDGKEPDMESLIGLVEFLQRKREGYDYGILLKDFLLPMARESASSYYKAYSYYLAGVYFMQKDDFEEALLYYTQALDACQPGKEDMRLKTLEIKLYFAIGAYWYSLGDLQKALESNEMARALNREAGDSVFDAYAMNNTALVYLALNENEVALPLFAKNLDRISILPPDVYPLTLTNMAICYIGLGKVDSALPLLSESLSRAQKSEGNYRLSNTYYYMGKAYALKGDNVLAMQYLEKGVSVSRRFDEWEVRVRIWMEGADILKKEGRYEQALALVDSALSAATLANNLPLQMAAMGMKSTLNDCLGNVGMAYASLKQYLDLVKRTNMEENERQARRQLLQSEFELARQRMDFEYKNRELEMRNRMNRYVYGFVICSLVLVFGILVLLFYYQKKKVEQKNQLLEEKALKDKLELKEKELVNEVMLRMSKDEVLKSTIKELASCRDALPEKERSALSPLIWKLRRSLNANMLAEFEVSFSQIHQSFFENLQKDFPRLTHAEKRLCAFIRLNLSTKEIAMVMNQDPNSVRIARVRLRRKLGLTSKSESLSEFLSRY